MEHELVRFIVVGFFAQLVDGALGMAYGLTSTTFLLSLGLTPAIASASVHAAEVFTTGARLCQELPTKLLMVLVGGVIVALSLRTIDQAL